jgi:hypothetical protein
MEKGDKRSNRMHGRQWLDGEMGRGPCELEKEGVTDVG